MLSLVAPEGPGWVEWEVDPPNGQACPSPSTPGKEQFPESSRVDARGLGGFKALSALGPSWTLRGQEAEDRPQPFLLEPLTAEATPAFWTQLWP